MDQRPNVRAKAIKLLEENIHDFGFGSDFLDTTTKV
jgi:hypothetical protein